jgi:hypothetical protein
MLHCVDVTFCSTHCHLCATSVNIHSSSSLYCISLYILAQPAIIWCTGCCDEGICCSVVMLLSFSFSAVILQTILRYMGYLALVMPRVWFVFVDLLISFCFSEWLSWILLLEHTERKGNQEMNETISQTCTWQQCANPYNLKWTRGNYIRNPEQYIKKQIPSSQQPVHLTINRLGRNI